MTEKTSIKTSISKSEKLQLLGLHTLAREHYRITNLCSDGVDAILDAQGYDKGSTLLHDSFWDDSISFDDALAKMGVVSDG